MQLIYQASTILEAHIVAGLLDVHGISAHVGGHYLQGAVGELAAIDFAHITVEDKDVIAAQALIERYEKGDFAHID